MQKHLEDNKTKIAIENAKLTHQTITDIATTPMPETAPTMGAPTAEMPQPQGVPNVNI